MDTEDEEDDAEQTVEAENLCTCFVDFMERNITPHTCPFKSRVWRAGLLDGFSKEICWCCASCTQNCEDEI